MEGRFEVKQWGTKGQSYSITVGFEGKSPLNGKTYELVIPPQAPSHDGSVPSVARIVEDDLNIQNRGIALISNSKEFNRIEDLAHEARMIGMQTLTEEERTTGVLKRFHDQKELNELARETKKRQLKEDTAVSVDLLRDIYHYWRTKLLQYPSKVRNKISKFWKK